MDFALKVFYYISGGPGFRLSMGMTTAVAVFIGAIIFDGVLTLAVKGIITVISYAFFVLQIDITRITSTYAQEMVPKSAPQAMSYGGIGTIAAVTIFWIVGMMLGV